MLTFSLNPTGFQASDLSSRTLPPQSWNEVRHLHRFTRLFTPPIHKKSSIRSKDCHKNTGTMNPGQDVQQHCGQSDTTDSMNQPLMSQQQRPRTLMTEQSPASETSRASSATNASQSSTPESPNPDTATPIQDHAPPSLPQATTTNMTQTQTRQPVGPQPPGGPDAYLQFMNMSQSATLAPSPSPTPQHSGGLHFIYDHHCDFVQFNVLNPLAVFVGPAYVKGWVIHINTKGTYPLQLPPP